MLFYALFSLAIIRPLTVAVSLMNMKLHPVTLGFMGWFGPRGIASILYVFIVLESNLEGMSFIYGTAMMTGLISVFAHGITVAPGAKWYGSRIESRVDADSNEMKEVPELPLRVPSYRLE